MKRLILPALMAVALASGPLSAQLNFPDLQYDAVDPLNLPPNLYIGEAAGVATNSNGDIFVYTRTGTPMITIAGARNVSHYGSRLFQFDRSGKFVRELGQGVYGFLQAQQARVDPQGNIWVVDQLANQVIKFNPEGRVVMVLGRKPEAMRVPANPLSVPADTYALVLRTPQPPAGAAGGAPPAGAPAPAGPPGAPAPPAPPAAGPGGGGGGGGFGGGSGNTGAGNGAQYDQWTATDGSKAGPGGGGGGSCGGPAETMVPKGGSGGGYGAGGGGGGYVNTYWGDGGNGTQGLIVISSE
jgi:hypothetical protein